MTGRSAATRAAMFNVSILGGGLGDGEMVDIEDRLEERAIANDNVVAKIKAKRARGRARSK
jgi:hypothetical protein